MPPARSVVIGLTGGIATGKSRVAHLLRSLGAAVECSDRIVRELQAPGGLALRRIAETFGEHYVTSRGELDRERLGDLVFRTPKAREKLNRIVHPLVFQELTARLQHHLEARQPVIVLDIPLLVEGRMAGQGSGAGLPFDQIVLVYAPEELQLERLVARDGLTLEEAQRRVASQLSIEEKRKYADVVIENGGDWESTEARVRALYQGWLEHPPHPI